MLVKSKSKVIQQPFSSSWLHLSAQLSDCSEAALDLAYRIFTTWPNKDFFRLDLTQLSNPSLHVNEFLPAKGWIVMLWASRSDAVVHAFSSQARDERQELVHGVNTRARSSTNASLRDARSEPELAKPQLSSQGTQSKNGAKRTHWYREPTNVGNTQVHTVRVNFDRRKLLLLRLRLYFCLLLALKPVKIFKRFWL